jgi:uncharacterized protein (TIGR02246 family)
MPLRTFREALDEHLSALQARDFERFAATVGDDVSVVDGRGAIVESRAEILRSHAEWFASPDRWRFEYGIRRLRTFTGAGLALIDVTYRQTPSADPVRFLLALVFERTAGGEWRFVYDQNTPCGPAD